MGKKHTTALKFLCISVLILFGAPKISIRVGSAPLYLIDFFIMLTMYKARSLPKLSLKPPYKNLVQFILFMILTNEFLNGLRIGNLIQPVYLMIRMSLAVSLFFVVPKIISSPKDLTKIIKYALVGSFITASLLILSSLPFTRDYAAIFLSNPILMPNAGELGVTLAAVGDKADRGTSLIGVSILSGAFLNVIWPLLLLLLSFYKPNGILKYILFATLLLVPISVIMTYSRGAILALLLVVMGITIFQKGKYRFIIVGLLVLCYVGFSTIGFDSELFMFDRIENRTIAALDNPYDDERETERIEAYIQPFGHVLNNPIYFFFGEGFARHKVANTPDLSGGINRADHSVLAKAYYAYGMITSLSIVFLYLLLINYSYKRINNTPNNNYFSSKFTRLLLVVLMGFSSWFLFGHAAVSNPRGSMLMFLVFGLVVSQREICRYESHQKSLDPQKY